MHFLFRLKLSKIQEFPYFFADLLCYFKPPFKEKVNYFEGKQQYGGSGFHDANIPRLRNKLIKSFCGGPGGGFLEKSPLAAGGKSKLIAANFFLMSNFQILFDTLFYHNSKGKSTYIPPAAKNLSDKCHWSFVISHW
jgi:hypothetical protein